jgi:hypothetical protein
MPPDTHKIRTAKNPSLSLIASLKSKKTYRPDEAIQLLLRGLWIASLRSQ